MARTTQFSPSVKAGIPQEPKTPEGWKLVRFGDVIQVAERPAELEDDQEYQLVTAKRSRGGIVPREKLLGKDILTKTQFYINAGDFLISRRQIIHGACGLVPPDLDGALVSNEYSALLTTNNLLKEYLAYFSHTNYFQQTCFQSSVGVDVEKMIFKLEDWLKYKFPLPPVKEQQKIAEILGSVDDAIAATQAVIDQTRKVKQGLLQQLLTRGIGHTKFKETAIGLIPESWEIKTVGELFEVQLGKMLSPKSKQGDQPQPYLANANVQWERISLENVPKMDFSENEKEKFILKQGDLLICEGGEVGRSAIWNGLVQGMYYQKALHRLRPKSDRIIPSYMLYYMVLKFQVEKAFSGEERTTTISHFPRIQLLKLPVLLPLQNEQAEIIRRITSISNALDKNCEKLETLEAIKQGLMQDLLTGRVRVADC